MLFKTLRELILQEFVGIGVSIYISFLFMNHRGL